MRDVDPLVPDTLPFPAQSHVPLIGGLTERELQVVWLVSHGLSNKEAAKRLDLAPNTVKAHIKRVMQKTGTRDRTHMVAHCLRNHIIR